LGDAADLEKLQVDCKTLLSLVDMVQRYSIPNEAMEVTEEELRVTKKLCKETAAILKVAVFPLLRLAVQRESELPTFHRCQRLYQ
jgi:hypothetical protein